MQRNLSAIQTSTEETFGHCVLKQHLCLVLVLVSTVRGPHSYNGQKSRPKIEKF